MNRLLCIFILLSFPYLVNGQDSQKSKSIFFPDRISPGFNYHLQLSHIDIAPFVSLPVTKQFHLGAGLNYLYYYRNSARKGTSAKGYNLFTRIYPIKNLFIHFEMLNSDIAYRNELIYEFQRVKKTNFYTGAGIRQQVTDHTIGHLMLLVDLSHSPESPYHNLFVLKAGLSF